MQINIAVREALKNRNWVLLKLQPYEQSATRQTKWSKLSPRYYEPFQITQKVGSVAYKLQLPPNSRIHPVLCVWQLKNYIESRGKVIQDLPNNIRVDEFSVQSRQVLQHWVIMQGFVPIKQGLIQWEDTDTDGCTWEDYEYLQQQFPQFNLEDKVDVRGGGYCQRTHCLPHE